jgi:hypothetical protein
MSISISKRSAAAFAYAYSRPYCTKNFIFAQISMNISNNRQPLIAEKFGFNFRQNLRGKL